MTPSKKIKPWMKWYPADWRSDPRLRLCSLAARGLWADLLSYMHEGEPYGHLTIDGIPPDETGIVSLVGRPATEVRKAMAELEAKQVYSRTEAGIIFSRRMTRDKEKELTDRENGKGGGNPKLKKAVNGGDNGGDNGGVNAGDNPPDKAHMLEARKKERKEDTASAVSSDATYAFESGIIRLNQKDFDNWRDAYCYLNLKAELLGLTQWAEMQGPSKWFFAVSGALSKKDREAKQAIEKAKNAPEFKYNGFPGCQ